MTGRHRHGQKILPGRELQRDRRCSGLPALQVDRRLIKQETKIKAPILALLVGSLASAGAFAQTNVTIYGSIDGGVDYLNNVKGNSFEAVNAGKRTPDRIGFKGVEDLGGGLAATFQLESGFNSDTGASSNPTTLFNRFSTVGLASKTFGNVRLGRQPDYIYDYVGSLSNQVPGLSSSYSPGNLDGLANQSAINNAVRIESPDFNGLQFGVLTGLGEVPGDYKSGLQYAAGAKYENGPMRVALGYTMAHNRTADLKTAFSVNSVLGQNLSPTGTMFAADHYSTWALGGQYKIGNFIPHVTFTRVLLDNTQGSVQERNYEVGVNIDMSAGQKIDILGISYSKSLFTPLTYNQFNLFFTHYMSVTTQLYAGGSLQRASGPGAVAGFFGYGASSTQSQMLARVGVQHSF
jgi:predicted porin